MRRVTVRCRSRIAIRAIVAIHAIAASPAIGLAQTCLGVAPFDAGITQLGSAMTITEGSAAFGATAGAGLHRGPFLHATAEWYRPEEYNTRILTLSGRVGVDIGARGWGICPLAGYARLILTGYGQRTEADVHRLALAAGGVAVVQPRWSLTPFVLLERSDLRGVSGPSAHRWRSRMIDGVIGAGLTLDRRLTLRPTIRRRVHANVPVGHAIPVYSLDAILSVGRRR